MANITLLGASYSDVPAVTLPQTGGGTVTFYENGGGSSQKIYSGSGTPSSSLGANGDIYILASAGGTKEAYPADYTTSQMSSTSSAGTCIGVSAEDGNSTSNMYSSGNNVTGVVDYTFDLSDIPSGATITNVSCQVKAHEENASRSSFTLQLYAGDTAKGSATTVSGTSNTIYNLDCGSWTVSELSTLILHTTYGYYGGLVAGATLTVEYTMPEVSYQVTLTGTSSEWSISGSGIYQKTGGSWQAVSSVTMDSAISIGT